MIVHRDLKPENLLLDESLNIKITDFGLSNMISPGKKFSTFCGSLHYACPEILRGEEYVGPGADIWSLGVILYCLVTGSQPWSAKSSEDILDQILCHGIHIPSWISKECSDLIQKMLRLQEKERITISEIRYHPWIIGEYKEPPKSLLPHYGAIQKIDEDIVKQLKYIGFHIGLKEIQDILEGEKTQWVATYHLLLKKKEDQHNLTGETLPTTPRSFRRNSMQNIKESPRALLREKRRTMSENYPTIPENKESPTHSDLKAGNEAQSHLTESHIKVVKPITKRPILNVKDIPNLEVKKKTCGMPRYPGRKSHRTPVKEIFPPQEDALTIKYPKTSIQDIRSRIITIMDRIKDMEYQKNEDMFLCEYKGVKFDLEIVAKKMNNIRGIKMSRQHGDSCIYKQLCDTIVSQLKQHS